LAGSLAATGSCPSLSLIIFALSCFLICLVAGANTGSVGVVVVAAVGVVELYILGGSNMGKD